MHAYSDRKVAHAYSDRVREGRRTMSIHLPQCGAVTVHADLCFLAAIREQLPYSVKGVQTLHTLIAKISELAKETLLVVLL